jgi:predicted ATPase
VLTTCPAVQVLATSRAPLRVQGEHECLTQPLPLPADDAPADGEALGRNDAVQLYVERRPPPTFAPNGSPPRRSWD